MPHPSADTSAARPMDSRCRTPILLLTCPRCELCVVRVPGFGRHWAWRRTVGWSGCEETGRPAARRSSAMCMHLTFLPVPRSRCCYPTTGVPLRSLPPNRGDGTPSVLRDRPRCRYHTSGRDRSGPRATSIGPFCGYALPPALGNTCWRLTGLGRDRWEEGGPRFAQPDSRRRPGAGQRGQGSSHQLAVIRR